MLSQYALWTIELSLRPKFGLKSLADFMSYSSLACYVSLTPFGSMEMGFHCFCC